VIVSFTVIECWLIRRISNMYGVPGLLNKRALTHQVSITGLHPLDRHDEGMKGHMTRWDMGGKASRGGVENVHYMVKYGV